MRRPDMPVVLFAAIALLASLSVPILAQQDPAPVPPTSAKVEPLPVALEDLQAILTAAQFEQAYRVAIAALVEKADAASVARQRALATAQAKHPDMPIDLRSGTYQPKPKESPEAVIRK